MLICPVVRAVADPMSICPVVRAEADPEPVFLVDLVEAGLRRGISAIFSAWTNRCAPAVASGP